MLKKIKYIFFLLLLMTTVTHSNTNVFIYATINNEIITNQDIEKEIKYLQILNSNLMQLNKKQKIEIAKNSLIKEIVKKKEIIKMFDINKQNLFVNDYLNNLYTKLNVDNEKDFKSILLETKNFTLEEIKKKIKIEILWNELIYNKYKDQVKINKKILLEKVNNLNNKTRKEYFLSEIVFEKKINEDLDLLIKQINSSISEIGFNNTANIYSTAESSNLGGKLGWVDEGNLSELMFDKLKGINENEYTDIIKIGNSFMIIKVEKIRFKELSIDKEVELNKMIKYETNKQLNQFSRIYFDKSKINYSINEN